MNERILILTLGTGKLEGADEDAGYIETQYQIGGEPYQKNSIRKKTNFVAEPIIDYFMPDIIIILGTVKSLWHQFYASLTTIDNNDKSYLVDERYIKLLEIERSHGIETEIGRVNELSREISKIFGEINTWKKYSDKYESKNPQIHVMLTLYGINEVQLKENYAILKGIEGYLSQDKKYEVAFDITHSFRSLPIYNLIIFNYIKNISRYHITISHIYYGNLDVKRELNGIAPIVDLKDLQDVLDLSNGVMEFKNTGNAVSLLSLIDRGDDIKEVLEKFDVATQLNAFDDVKKNLIELVNKSRQNRVDDRFTGVREMIETVLETKFFENNSFNVTTISDLEIKYRLSMWFFNQNRMGLGLATGLEVLRDINTPAFINARGFDLSKERLYRENAESYFIKIAKELSDKAVRNPLENAVYNLGVKLLSYKAIRNVFAHSLSRIKNNADILGIKSEVAAFKSELSDLKHEYDRSRTDYENLFRPKPNTTNPVTSNKCRIVVGYDHGTSDSNRKQQYSQRYNISSNGSVYDVYYLNARVYSKLFDGYNVRGYHTSEKAYFLYKYLAKNIADTFNYTSIQIVLVSSGDVEKDMVFRIFLEELRNADSRIDIFNGTPLHGCPKLGIIISKEEYALKYDDKKLKYEDIMNLPLEKI